MKPIILKILGPGIAIGAVVASIGLFNRSPEIGSQIQDLQHRLEQANSAYVTLQDINFQLAEANELLQKELRELNESMIRLREETAKERRAWSRLYKE